MKVCLTAGWNHSKDFNGLVDLCDKLREIRPTWIYSIRSYKDEIDEPYDIYIGHSFGVWASIHQIEQFSKYAVKYFALIDGVDLHWDQSKNFFIPKNVQKADSFKRTEWNFLGIPPSSPIRNPSKDYQNHNVRMGGFPFGIGPHANAPRNSIVVQKILETVAALPE